MKKQCGICFHRCALEEGQRGLCRARGNREGRIESLNYGRISSMALDPIEKKPLNRFFPGSRILSVGSFGCNLSCPFCQNHQIAAGGQEAVETIFISPEELAEKAEELVPLGNIGVAYTYNEPLVGYEYLMDCARLIRRRGMKNAVVTNGTIEAEPLEALLPFIDAMNIDLKGFTPDFYHRLGGDLETVKRTIEMAGGRCHVEVTTLIIPGENDSLEEMERLAGWLASVDRRIPLHVSRFFPRWRMTDRAATPVSTVYDLAEAAGRYLEHVYTGNC